VIAALIPAILYYVALFIQADLEAARSGITRIEESRIPKAGPVLKQGWYFPLPFAVLIYALFWLNRSAETSALMAAAVVTISGVVIGYQGKRLSFKDLLMAMRGTGLGVLDIFMIGAAAGIVIGVLNISGLGFALTLAMVQIAGGHLIPLLMMAAVVCIILGMGMPTIGVYVLLATLVAPALIEVGINDMAAHLFILYFGMMSMITPPVAIGAFTAATLTGSDPMKTAVAAMRFGWLAFVIPFAFVASPTLLMNGDPFFILADFAGALMACWLVSIGIIGFWVRPVAVWMRIAFVVSGLSLILPLGAFIGAIEINIAGLIVAVILIWSESKYRKGQLAGG
ncbi:MAG: TRAP transporter large permease subunit, partial [Rhodospirillales bacterium]|nr:TRAP transporter large permease subunit [Rhodospirillales bacterium]